MLIADKEIKIKCLHCRENAQELYLQSQYHIYLSDRRNFLTFLSRKNKKQVTGYNYTKSPGIKVFYCKNCNLVWFYIDE